MTISRKPHPFRICSNTTENPYRVYAPLEDVQKTRTLQHLLSTTLEHASKATAATVVKIAAEHGLKKCKRDDLIQIM